MSTIVVMKPCPSCQFLLPGDAAQCQFCRCPLPTEATGSLAAMTTPWDRTAPVAGRTPIARRRLAAVGTAILAIVAAAGALAVSSRNSDSPWTRYASPDRTFSVQAPSTPDVTTEPLQLATGERLQRTASSFDVGAESRVVVAVSSLDAIAPDNPDLVAAPIAALQSKGVRISDQRSEDTPDGPATIVDGTTTVDGVDVAVHGQITVSDGRLIEMLRFTAPTEVDEVRFAFERMRTTFSSTN